MDAHIKKMSVSRKENSIFTYQKYWENLIFTYQIFDIAHRQVRDWAFSDRKMWYLHMKNPRKRVQTRKIPRMSIRISHGRSQLSHDSNIIYIIMHKILPPRVILRVFVLEISPMQQYIARLSCPFLALVCHVIEYVTRH